MIIKDHFGPLLKKLYAFMLALDQFAKLLFAIFHTFTNLLQRLLLSVHYHEAQLLNFHKIRPEIFSKSLFEAINTIVREDISFSNPILLLEIKVILALVCEFCDQ
jgi:hypothetical protein